MNDIRSLARSTLVRGTGLAFSARGVGAGGMLLTQILIARQLGVTGAGRIATGLTIMGILSIIGRYGADRLIVRRVAQHADWNRLHGEYQTAMRMCAPILIGLALVQFVASAFVATHLLHDADSVIPLRWLALALPAFGLVAVQGEALKGAGSPGIGSAVQSVVGPAVTLVILLTGSQPSLHRASIALAVGIIASSITAHLAWSHLTGRRRADHPRIDVRQFAAEAGPFVGTSMLTLVITYVPLFSLAILGDPDEVGRFFAADRWTRIPTMMLVAVNATVGPRFARLWAGDQRDAATDLLRRSTRATSLLAVLVAGGLIGAAPWLLRLFGPGYEAAVPALRILAAAQFVALACGPVTSLLVMAGGERRQRTATGLAALVMLILCPALVPVYGLLGAAVATAAALVVNKVTILIIANKSVVNTQASPVPSG